MTFPFVQLPNVPPSTIVSQEIELFIPYFNRLYKDIAFSVNEKDHTAFPIQVTSTPQPIPNVPNYGSFIVCLSGSPTGNSSSNGSGFPTITASLCKSDQAAAGSVVVLGSQAGTGAWAGISLTITSTATNFQIAHNRAGVSGNFNIRIVGSITP